MPGGVPDGFTLARAVELQRAGRVVHHDPVGLGGKRLHAVHDRVLALGAAGHDLHVPLQPEAGQDALAEHLFAPRRDHHHALDDLVKVVEGEEGPGQHGMPEHGDQRLLFRAAQALAFSRRHDHQPDVGHALPPESAVPNTRSRASSTRLTGMSSSAEPCTSSTPNAGTTAVLKPSLAAS